MFNNSRGRKFCPRCGMANNAADAYCMKCGYSFKGTKKKSSFKTILILLIVLLIGWSVYRIFTGKPVIPDNLLNLVKNMSSNKTR
jgi:hypothetical protein